MPHQSGGPALRWSSSVTVDLVSMAKWRTQDFCLGGVVYSQLKTLNNPTEFFSDVM